MRTVALALCGLLTLSEAATAQSADQLVGTWERFAQINRAGKPLQSELKAVVIFSADGYYSHTAVRRSGPKTSRPLAQFTLKELLERFEGADARYGRFTVSGDTVFRTIVAALDPTTIGTPAQVQLFEVVGDTLILRPTSTSDKGRVKFRRMR